MHFAAPFLAVLAALGATVEAERAVCSRKQYADVAAQIQNPAYFCKFYLKQARKTSPLKKYGSRSLTRLCKCFVQNSPRVTGPYEPLRPKAPPAGCPITLYRPLKNQYKDPVTFCRFYLGEARKLSPLPGIPNPATVKAACRCYLDKKFAPQQPSSSVTTETPEPTVEPTDTTTTDEPVATTTTTDEPVATTTTSDIIGPIGGTRTTTTTTSVRTTTTSTSSTTSRTATTVAVGTLQTLTTILPTTTTVPTVPTTSTTTTSSVPTTTVATTAFTSTLGTSTTSSSGTSTT